MPRHAGSFAVLIRAPSGRDAELTCAVLRRHDLDAEICATHDDLCQRIEAEAACAVITEEALDRAAADQLAAVLARQQPWSDFPLIVLGSQSPAASRRSLDGLLPLGNVTVLDRPVKARTLVAAIHVALRGRRRQYAARHAIQERDDFLAMLGHELRNPLAGVVLAAELIRKTGSTTPALDRHLGVIDRQTRNLTRLVDDLLDVSRVTTGKVVLQRESLAIDDVLQRGVQLIEPEARARSLTVELVPAGVDARIDGDPVRLEQVFGNLLKNAVKYSPPGGQITVTAHADQDSCTVSVRDTGIGMTREMLQRAFDLFSQADSALDRSQGGMGIGLTLVKNLVELHGGVVEARSEGPGRGSEITVRLPRATAAEVAVRAPGPGRQTPPVALTVVVVEDNDDLRTTSQEVLQDLGCRVVVAADGPAGLASILEVRPDMALVDIGLPAMDGYAVAAEVRKELGPSPVLVALTGYGQPQDRERALGAGFDAHLTKPVSFAALQELLTFVTDRQGNSRKPAAVPGG
ncbi:MAG TPA: hybrid sensor histidine kinase/response regulator [Kofleriaceae bacterium]|nr:hybrid sensor histidine kinase/response regulator [Kofleriaceae bacterium]